MTHLLSEQKPLDLSESVKTLAFWASWLQIIGVAAAVLLGLWAIRVAKKQLTGARRSAAGQFILGIDEAFRAYENVRRYINGSSSRRPEIADLYRYIAIFERLGLFIDSDLLTTDEINEFYGERFENLIHYGDGRFCKDFRESFPPRARPRAWDGFIRLWRALAGVRPYLDDIDQEIAQVRRDNEKELVTVRASREEKCAEATADRSTRAAEPGHVNAELERRRAILRQRLETGSGST